MKNPKNTVYNIKVDQNYNQTTADMIGQKYSLQDIDIPYLLYKREFEDCLLRAFECREVVYSEEITDLSFTSYHCIFRNT